MVQTGNNCGYSTATQANYINVNGKRVLSQYFSKGQGKMVYAHKDSRGIGGVVYKPYKPGNSPYQQRTNKADAYSAKPSTPSVNYKSNDSYGSTNQRRSSYTLQPTGQYDRYGRAIYRRVPSQTQNYRQQAQPRTQQQASSSSVNSLKFGSDNSITLAPGRQVALSVEKGGAKLVIQNQTYAEMHGNRISSYRQGASQAPKNIQIKRTPNRYGDYDYSIVQYKNGKKKEQRLSLPDTNLGYNPKKNNARIYHIRSGGRYYDDLTFGYKDVKDITVRKPRVSKKDLQPQQVRLAPGESVINISPHGTGTVNLNGKQYKVTNDKDDFAYIIYRKQADGTTKPFYRTDSRFDADRELDSYLNFDLDLSYIKDLPKPKEVQQAEQDKATDPFQDDKTAFNALKESDLVSIFDADEVKALKKAKQELKAKVFDNDALNLPENSKLKSEVENLLAEIPYSSELSVEKRADIIEKANSEVDSLLKALETKKEKPIGGIVTELNPGSSQKSSLFDDLPSTDDKSNLNLDDLFDSLPAKPKQGSNDSKELESLFK